MFIKRVKYGEKIEITYMGDEDDRTEYKVKCADAPNRDFVNSFRELNKAFGDLAATLLKDNSVAIVFDEISSVKKSDEDDEIESCVLKARFADYMIDGIESIGLVMKNVQMGINHNLDTAISNVLEQGEAYIKGKRAQETLFDNPVQKEEDEDADLENDDEEGDDE